MEFTNIIQKNTIPMLICFCIMFFSCNSDDVADDKKLTLLYLEQAKISWTGTTSDYYVNINKSSNKDTTLSLVLKLYQNYKGNTESVTVDLVIDADSLNKAILLGEGGNTSYNRYKNAKLLPSQYYTIPTNMTLDAGQKSIEAQITINKSELLKDAHTTLQGGKYVLPVRISDPTKYRVNPTVCFTMFFFQFPDNQLDPTKPDPSNPSEIDGYTLHWNDEFNGSGAPDPNNWNAEYGFMRNQELQWYQADNASCGDGVLTITGKRERFKNPNYVAGSSDWTKNREYVEYTSSSLTTLDKMHFKFGRIEVRAKIPTAKGAWPAIWTLGESGEWPSCGEIDILEYYLANGEPHIHANFAWGKANRWEANWDSWKRPFSEFTAIDPEWANKFHTWVMDWNEDKTYMYIDGELIREVWTNSMWNGGYDGNWGDPFHQPHYVLLNLALGSNGGNPGESTFPMKYEVDYVRIYKKNE